MISVTTRGAKAPSGNGAAVRGVLSPLNLHWAGIVLLVAVNVYLLAQMFLLWHGAAEYNADAIAQQQVALRQAEVAAQPLRGLDAKVTAATVDADRFYTERLPGSDSEVAAELGALTKKAGVRLAGAGYVHQAVLAGTTAELTQMKVDARLSGDYRPLVLFLNSLERDKMFFVIDGVTLTGQQTGTVNLRLRLTTYEQGHRTEPDTVDAAASDTTPVAGGQGR
jgi:type IV pilus assembly protein PilO